MITVEYLANLAIRACESIEAPYMLTGALAYNYYAIPRSTRDVDIITQKIRWGRSKDLDDARDVLAVQGPETLDMTYIRNWCSIHGTTRRLETILASLPPL